MPSSSRRNRGWPPRPSNGRGNSVRPKSASGRGQSHYRAVRSTTSALPQRTPSVTPSQPSFLGREASTLFEGHPQRDHVAIGMTPVPDDDFLEHIVMAVNLREKGKVGCAYYIAAEDRLLCMEEFAGGGLDAIQKLKLDIQPTTVIVSPQSDARGNTADTITRRQASLVDSVSDEHPPPYETEIRPSSEFGYENALSKLLGLPPLTTEYGDHVELLIPGEPSLYDEDLRPDELGLTNRQGKFLQISARLDLDNKISIGCAGAVISYLQRRRSSGYLPGDTSSDGAFRVRRLEMFNLRGTMLVNTDTLVSLQIIQPESHPNAFKQGPGASGPKESLSIYGLFQNYARTTQGKTCLRQAFLRPSLDIDEINSRLDFVSAFVHPENQLLCKKISKSLGKIKNMRTTVTMLQKGIDSGKQRQKAFTSGVWASILEFCYHTIDIADALKEVVGTDPLHLCARAGEVFDRHNLRCIGAMVFEAVDLESSTDEQRTVVKRGLRAELDEIKDVYDGMDDILTEKVVEVGRTMAPGLRVGLNVVFTPHLGFHLTLPLDAASRQPTYDGADLGWQRVFTTDHQAYFKNEMTREMDHELGDLYAVICEFEIEIAYDLAQRVLEHEKLLVTASDLCGELDCALTFAHMAHEYKLTRPKMTEDNIIDIKGGRHLLQEMSVPSFVPNDTFLVGGHGHDDDDDAPDGPCMLLLTGPNYSGKSVYQKQVALAVYMAQIGSFLAAESATIGITDKILTRITTRETVSRIQSSFLIDMQQIAIALNSCTRRSLVVIDEFGKGTDSCDGAGLAAGVFHYLLSLRTEAPKALVATHFHEIFDEVLFGEFEDIAFAHMEVRVDGNDDGDVGEPSSEVTYLYNLRPGRSDLSYGTQCAATNGVPEEIVERAIELARLSRKGKDLVTICSTFSQRDTEELKSAESAARGFVSQEFLQEMTKEDLLSTLDGLLEPSRGE